ncbi:hypothetical protein JYU34_000355 [Plutella xylostella]|uniref:Uncharacterized protein n=1 Tax=Plutella xylostella TaxID=51655 RepID=A0ABQ7R7I0_PLUXY|nr:hypothetical protein JYU34_000355 [Plutella xylostella]
MWRRRLRWRAARAGAGCARGAGARHLPFIASPPTPARPEQKVEDMKRQPKRLASTPPRIKST